MIVPIAAFLVETGDTLTDREGRYRRLVTDVDPFSNVHGRYIIRTGTGTTVVEPYSTLYIEV